MLLDTNQNIKSFVNLPFFMHVLLIQAKYMHEKNIRL